MITLFIIWLARKLRGSRRGLFRRVHELKMIPAAILLAFLSGSVQGQERTAQYNVVHNGEVKGTLTLYEKKDAGMMKIRIKTEVNTRFVFRVVIKSVEEVVFENGNLIYSFIFREVNGREKVNQRLQSSGNGYQLTGGGDIAGLPEYPVRSCILLLYCQEPVNVRRVYSDSYHQYLEIKEAGKNRYRVVFPDGSSNYYSYRNGVCIRVEVDRFYHLEFVLK
jgi:hypothetical protein